MEKQFQNPPKYRAYTSSNFRSLPQIQRLSPTQQSEMEIVSHVFPFKSNNYVTEQLINWDDPQDPMFVLTFPQKGMLKPHHFHSMARAVQRGNADEIQCRANEIRMELNPHPAGQLHLNVPRLEDGTRLTGVQHKYQETVLFFPSQGQTCHAYCSFCFRWPQFIGNQDLKFATKEADLLVQYLHEHPEVTDVLFTGGDPMVMRARVFRTYIDEILDLAPPSLKTIRIGTKSLSYWPYKYISDPDSEEMLETLRRIVDQGLHLSIMAHFNHPRELETEAVATAIERLRGVGATIRTQSPLLRHINDSEETWATMWQKQVDLGCVPYYMFIVRDTGAQHYFGVSLVRAWEIFKSAMQQVSGITRTARGPSMSADPGKVQIVGVSKVNGRDVMILRMIQGRNPMWTYTPFLADYDPNALWLDDLTPAFGESKFFFEDELEEMHIRAGLPEVPAVSYNDQPYYLREKQDSLPIITDGDSIFRDIG